MERHDSKQRYLINTLGASNLTGRERAPHDFYATDPIAGKLLEAIVPLHHSIWEPACGAGHLSKVFEDNGHDVKSTDLFDHGYGESGVDFLSPTLDPWLGGACDIITNPPYRYALEFCEKAYDLVNDGYFVCMFLRLQFLEGISRRRFFERSPLWKLFVSTRRILCPENGDFERFRKSGGVNAYAWFVWKKGYQGEPTLHWFN